MNIPLVFGAHCRMNMWNTGLVDRMEQMGGNAIEKATPAWSRRRVAQYGTLYVWVGTVALRSYVHGLQEALWNHAASLGREVPKQSRSHLAAGIKIQETRSTVLVLVHCSCKAINRSRRLHAITLDWAEWKWSSGQEKCWYLQLMDRPLSRWSILFY